MLIKKPKLFVIYDIDDTLVKTFKVFKTVISYFMNYERLKKDEIIELYENPKKWYSPLRIGNKEIEEEIYKADMELIKKLKRSNQNPFRYEVFKSALEEVTNKYDLKIKENDIDLLAKIPFSYRLKPKYETLEGLKYLKKEALEHKIEFLIFSKGTYEDQTKKLTNLELNFIKNQNIYIGMDKSSEHLKDFLERYYSNASHFIMIGDSLKDDMISAIKIKEFEITALWIKHYDFFSKNLNERIKVDEYSKNKIESIIRKTFY